jgi:glucosamine--fructose-6-phosphate aminotransferase (isomerizing)
MCGIVGYVGQDFASEALLDGLTHLEYRGYDSAGLAVSTEPGVVTVRRVEGRVESLRGLLAKAPALGHAGLAHTRWATHGGATVDNAHPHNVGRVTVVHNGIIENHAALRRELQRRGRAFRSETDTEVVAHLIDEVYSSGEAPLFALRAALRRIEGAFALVVLFDDQPDRLLFARRGSPLVIGVAESAFLLASDPQAIRERASRFCFLEDGDHGEVTTAGSSIFSDEERVVRRTPRPLNSEHEVADCGDFSTYMRKEIEEQPGALNHMLTSVVDLEGGVALRGIDARALVDVERLIFSACGSSRHAAMVVANEIERWTGVTTQVELASELRYSDLPLGERVLVVGVSQSGETADTLASLEDAKARGAKIAAVCNVDESSIARLCREGVGVLLTHAGPEVGVASTKAFFTQIAGCALIGAALAMERGRWSDDRALELLSEMATASEIVPEILGAEEQIRGVGQTLSESSSVLFLGRGPLHAVALEGALKLAEISYIHAQGFAAGEMKHGPIALVEQGTPVVAIAGAGPRRAKLLANLAEVRARGALTILVGSRTLEAEEGCDILIEIPLGAPLLTSLVSSVVLQLLAYHAAMARGLDVDRPRNLAKSVTVE